MNNNRIVCDDNIHDNFSCEFYNKYESLHMSL